jgi:hypothetical protein
LSDMNHTTLTRLSIQTTDSGQSSPALDVAGPTSFTSSIAVSGYFSTTSNVRLGSSGVSFLQLRKSTASVAIAATAADSVTTDVPISGAAAGDVLIAIEPASIWSGAYFDVGLNGYFRSANTLTLVARNSTTTTVNTAAMNVDFYWLDLA